MSEDSLQPTPASEKTDAAESPLDDAPLASGEKTDASEWTVWPPSPKMQIVLIAVVFGLFNCMLAAVVWAVVVN